MTTTTEYGTWANHGDGGTTVEDAVTTSLGDHAADYDVAGLVGDYRAAINAQLADTGITLAGSEFYGPHPRHDNAGALIADAIAAVDFWEIAAANERR